MVKKFRILMAIFILFFGSFIIFIIYQKRYNTEFKYTFSVFYEIIGKSTNSIDHALGKILPVNDMDEKELGDLVKSKYCRYTVTTSDEYKYLNQLIKNLSRYKKKNFGYQVYIHESSVPNAWALPGGNIFITKGMIDNLKSESELVAVLAHEMGHVELSHCFNRVKFQVLSSKKGSQTAGQIIDNIYNFIIGTSYSKSQENEADDYAFRLLLDSDYNPTAMEKIFRMLIDLKKKYKRSNAVINENVILEYYMTHPYLELRADKYHHKSINWWKKNKSKKRYNGIKNLNDRSTYPGVIYESEWTKGFQFLDI